MNDRIQGFIQLIFVVIFIVGSFMVSGLLQSEKPSRGGNANPEETRALFVEAKTVSPAPYKITFGTSGTIQARSDVNITSQISGRVTKISDQMFSGGEFKASDVLFEIDNRDFENEVRRLQSVVSQASTTLKLEEAESNAAIEEWKILRGDEPAPDLVARKPQMAEAKANLNSAWAQLKTAKLNLKRTRFSLPFDGRITNSTLELGQFVSAGQSYGSAYDTSALEISSLLKDEQLQWLLKAEEPTITIKTTYLGEERNYPATLKRSNASLDAQTRFAEVSFDFKEPPENLTPGLFATVVIEGQEIDNVTLLPSDALQKGDIIWLVNDDKTLKSVTPTIAYMDDDILAATNFSQSITAVTSRISGATDGVEVTTKTATDATEEMIDEGDKPRE